jgi:MarR family transcriptional regulator, organic hydroperoxide resistance regulator
VAGFRYDQSRVVSVDGVAAPAGDLEPEGRVSLEVRLEHLECGGRPLPGIGAEDERGHSEIIEQAQVMPGPVVGERLLHNERRHRRDGAGEGKRVTWMPSRMLREVDPRVSRMLYGLDHGLRDGLIGRVGYLEDRIEKEQPPGEAGVTERQMHGQKAAAGLPDDDVPSAAQLGEIGGVTTEPEVLATHIGYLVDRAAQVCSAIFAGELAPTGLSIRAAGIILVLDEAGAASQLQIGQMMRLERSTASAAADELERAGLISRRRDPRDRRLNELTLTRRGRALAPQVREASNTTEKRLLTGLTQEDRAALQAGLGTIVATGDTAAAEPPPPDARHKINKPE